MAFFVANFVLPEIFYRRLKETERIILFIITNTIYELTPGNFSIVAIAVMLFLSYVW